jgi:hypothetical protein
MNENTVVYGFEGLNLKLKMSLLLFIGYAGVWRHIADDNLPGDFVAGYMLQAELPDFLFFD